MLIKGIDLPEILLRAQEAGELVVFAGAGVSYAAPSSLPLFDELALRIGKNSGVSKEDREPADHYLGRLKQKGITVHEKAAEILINNSTKPHDLHRELLKLFPSIDKIRLVTTNFDTHFLTASADVFDGKPEIFFAPALPLGDDFSGIVYLHGYAGKQPRSCVLTDEDFGRAYLTQAWASRFLASMFSRYVILFVGYSHNDVVMTYLARGLPPAYKLRRFAFTTGDKDSSWEFLGVKPIRYQKCEGENPHQQITISVAEWVKEVRLGLLEKAERIRTIAEATPPLEGEDTDYLKYSLSNLDTARIFFKHAKTPDWISWLEKHGFIQGLFKRQNDIGEFENSLGFWLAENFLVEHSQELMLLLERFNCQMNRHLCWWIWRRLFVRNKDSKSAVPTAIFSQWVSILLEQPHDSLPPENWAELITVCQFPDDKTVSVLLFARATRPRLVLNKALRIFSDDIGQGDKIVFDIQYEHGRHEEYWLREVWQKLFQPNLRAYANDLEPILISHLTAANTLRTLSLPKYENLDVFGFHRQSISPDKNDQFPHTFDILVDAFRGILDWFLETQPQYAAGRIEQLLTSGVPILRRLAIYGFGKRTDVSPDEKLSWIEQNNLLYTFKADVFWLLEQSYPKASDGSRKRIIEKALLGSKWEGYEDIGERTKDYEIFNLFVWLHRIAPDCTATIQTLNALKQKNPDFGEREYPQLDHHSDGVQSVDATAGLTADDILQKPPEAVLDALLKCKPRTPFERNRSSYCNAISAAISKQPDWAVKWTQMLTSKKLMDTDLWYCVGQGWRNASLSPDHWKVILDFVETAEAPIEFFSAFAEVLENGSRKESFTLPDGSMEQAETIAVRIWNLALKTSPIETNSYGDWLGIAINRPGGKLAEFWLQRISVSRKTAGENWSGIPQTIKTHLTEILHSNSGAAAHARIVLASQLHYFFSLDSAFAMAELFPLFNWQVDELQAEQSWHGFIFWGRWLVGFAEQLMPHFTETIARIATIPDRVREALIYQIAGVTLFRIENPLENGWLPTVLQKLQDKDLIQLASTIDRYLGDVEASLAEKIWATWLADYWKMRLSNTPKALLPGEANEMACWALSVGRYFPDAVKLAVSTKEILTFEHTPIFLRLDEKKELVRNYADAGADFVLLYVQSPLRYFFADEHTARIWQILREKGVAKEKLKKIREAMFRLGHDPGEP
jgi:hypothetical protein